MISVAVNIYLQIQIINMAIKKTYQILQTRKEFSLVYCTVQWGLLEAVLVVQSDSRKKEGIRLHHTLGLY